MTPVGFVKEEIIEQIKVNVSATLFDVTCRVKESGPEPSCAFDSSRNQYRSAKIIGEVTKDIPNDALRLVCVTEYDIFEPALTFVFGAAQLSGMTALVSLFRLRQEFYGLPENNRLLLERIMKEVNHELGHTFGLTHCSQERCVMHLSLNVRQLDSKTQNFCMRCDELVEIELEKLQE